MTGGYELVRWATPSPPNAGRAVRPRSSKSGILFAGAGPAEPNFGVFDNWILRAGLSVGLIAGKMTKTNTVGAVAAMGIPEVNHSATPSSWAPGDRQSRRQEEGHLHRPALRSAKGHEAVIAQIDAGVDVIYAERFSIEAAASVIWPISNMSDRQSSLAPETVIAWPGLEHVSDGPQAIKLVKGVYTAQDYGDFLAEGQGRLRTRTLSCLRGEAARDQGNGPAQRRTIIAGEFRVDVDEATPVSD